ncbi:MAG: ribonuclease Z [Acidimicrobiales bacterium]
MPRELVVLGCASQVPTRYRNHNGYFLRWDQEGILFDPGEGTQRQMVHAGVASSSITHICITHFHGDHCLGLPGVLGRLATDQVRHRVTIAYPAAGEIYLDRLRHASVSDTQASVSLHPVHEDGPVLAGISARALEHRTETVGWRVEEPDGRRMLPDRLRALGIEGPDIATLQREGSISAKGRIVALEEVSEPRAGQKVAFVMDTRMCDAARELADGVDMLICESTYLESEADLAERYAHMTAAQAATLARDAGVGRLVLTHYSSRYPDPSVFEAEARPIFADSVAVNDLDVIAVPRSRGAATPPPR